jgi:hypothetical protein
MLVSPIDSVIGGRSMGAADRECVHESLPPHWRTREVSVSVLIPNAPDLTSEDEARIKSAYEQACVALVAEHRYPPDQLANSTDTMVAALLELYRAGQHDVLALARFASWRALQEGRDRWPQIN